MGETVAVAIHLGDVDVVSEPVEQGAGQALGAEHGCPLVEGQVAGDDGGAAFVPLGEHLKQQLGAGLRQRHVADHGRRASRRAFVQPNVAMLDIITSQGECCVGKVLRTVIDQEMSMSDQSADVSSLVEYRRDKWLLDRVPWAMWFCVAGTAVVLHAGDRGRNGAALAIVYLALLGLAFAGWAASTLIARSTSLLAGLILGVAIVMLVVVVTILVAGTVGSNRWYGRLLWSGLVHPPPNVFGWMLIYLGCGYIAYALFRHHYRERPIVQLSQSGVSFNRPWLRDLFIPWQDIQAVGDLDISRPGGPPATYPGATVVVVTNNFYARNIASKRSFLAPPGTEAMFQPKGAMMQVVLTSPELVVTPNEFRAPIEARWRAFRDRSVSVPQAGDPSGKCIALGTWSFDGSWWQVIHFLAPLVAAAAVVLHARGFWQM